MKSYTSIDRYKIPGRGLVVVIDAPNPDRLPVCPGLPKSGETVLVDGIRYEVRAIEAARALIDPPFMLPRVGFLVR